MTRKADSDDGSHARAGTSKRGGRRSTTRPKGNGDEIKGKMSGWGGPAKGAGHGGPAKGPGRGGPANVPQLKDMGDNEALELLKQNLLKLSINADCDAARIRATEALLNRIEGPPVQRNFNYNVNDEVSTYDDDELEHRIAEAERAIAAAEAGASKASRSKESEGVVHRSPKVRAVRSGRSS